MLFASLALIMASPAAAAAPAVSAEAVDPAPHTTSAAQAEDPHRAPPGYELVWADEFSSGDRPDLSRWDYDAHRNAIGWYNNELQYYAADRTENARVEEGRLVIEARRETLDPAQFADFGGQGYSSARLFTQGKASWTYGFFEVKAKLPCGRGTWPAIWMLPDDPEVKWPAGREIDIMEHVGYEPGVIHHSVHTKAFNFGRGTQKTTSYALETACDRFHRYQLLWTPKALVFGVDDTAKFAFRKMREGKARWPFDEPMHLILNVAVGGDWGGRKGIDAAAFPVRMEIDHVRVYQKTGTREQR